MDINQEPARVQSPLEKNTKWKSGLLKSGFPLEYVVARQLSDGGHAIFGEYPFLRPDERGKTKEFSVDIRTFRSTRQNEFMHTLSLLVECKYRVPGTTWIFAPVPSSAYTFGMVVNTEEISTSRLSTEEMWRLESAIGYCVGGVELGVEGVNRDAVRHGVFQLRYAMPTLLEQVFKIEIRNSWGGDGSHLSMCCPILVTTAELRVLRPNVTLDDFRSAQTLDEISELREAAIVNEQPGPQLKNHADRIARRFEKDVPNIEARLSALAKTLTGPDFASRGAPDLDSFRRSFANAAELVLVINLAALPRILEKLHLAIEKQLATRKTYGRFVQSGSAMELHDLKGNLIASGL